MGEDGEISTECTFYLVFDRFIEPYCPGVFYIHHKTPTKCVGYT